MAKNNSKSNEKLESSGGLNSDQLVQFIERLERLEEEKKALSDDTKDIFAEIKTAGYDIKIVKEVLKLRKLDPNEREERISLIEVYMTAANNV